MSFDLVESNISLVKLQIRFLDKCQLIRHRQSKTQKHYFVFIHYHIVMASLQLLSLIVAGYYVGIAYYLS